MDITLDNSRWPQRPAHQPRQGRIGRAEAFARAPGLDWPGLMARLAAAYGCRRMLASADFPSAANASFDPAHAGQIIAFAVNPPVERDPADCLPDVNQTISANGKPAAAITADITDQPESGDRGLV